MAFGWGILIGRDEEIERSVELGRVSRSRTKQVRAYIETKSSKNSGKTDGNSKIKS